VGWKDVIVPKPYPREFRDDVVRVARSRDDGVTMEQIAADFGVHPLTLSKWMRQADVDDGVRSGTSTSDSAELRDARRRTKAVGAGERSPAPGRGLSVAVQPAGKRLYPHVSELAADGIPVAVTCRVLKLARQPYYRWLSAPVTDSEIVEAYRANALFDAHGDDSEFGYRFLVEEARQAGEAMAERVGSA
jgi:putative transposase